MATIQDSLADTDVLAAGTGVTITQAAPGDPVVITSTGGYTDEQVRDVIGTALVAGANVSVTVNDAGDTITVAATDTNTTDQEVVRDTIAAALVAGTGITITPNDGADTITITATDDIPKSLIDAKGDLLVGTADNTVARKAVGSDGQVLTADAASTGGVKWAAAGGTSPRTKIAEVTLATAAASIDFTSIPGTYDDLEIEFVGKHNTVTTAMSVNLTLNNDTTDAHYARAYHVISSGGNSGGVGINDRAIGQLLGSTPTLISWTIPLYAGTTWQKVVGALVYQSGSGMVRYSSLWADTSAITRVTLTSYDGGNFAAGTRVRLYGLKDI